MPMAPGESDGRFEADCLLLRPSITGRTKVLRSSILTQKSSASSSPATPNRWWEISFTALKRMAPSPLDTGVAGAIFLPAPCFALLALQLPVHVGNWPMTRAAARALGTIWILAS